MFLLALHFQFIPQSLKTIPIPSYMIIHAQFHCLTRHYGFRCFSSLTFRERLLTALYSLPHVRGMLSPMLRLTQQRFLHWIQLYLNMFLMLYEPQPCCVFYNKNNKDMDTSSHENKINHIRKNMWWNEWQAEDIWQCLGIHASCDKLMKLINSLEKSFEFCIFHYFLLSKKQEKWRGRIYF